MTQAFKHFTLWTVFITFALIVIGGIVRTTGSGLGCPDWPLCYGQAIPPYDIHSQIEFSHRLTTSLVSLSLVVLVVWASWRYRGERAILAGAWLALLLLAVQIGLGAIVVVYELPPALVGIHLANALLIFGALVFVSAHAHRPWTTPEAQREPGLRRLIVLSALAVYVLVFSGSVVTNTNSGLACSTWPLCNEQVYPTSISQAINLAHRYFAGAVGMLLLYVFARTRRAAAPLRRTAQAAAGLFGLQVLAGALNVFARLQPALNTLHLALAAALWGVMVVFATVTWHALRPAANVHTLQTGAGPIEQSYSASGD